MKYIVYLLFCFLSVTLSAQRVQVQVLEALSNRPLPRASVWINGEYRELTNDSGMCELEVKSPIQIRVSYIGYQTQLVTFKKVKKDTISILLVANEQVLNEVEVLPELPKFLFFGSPETEVIDYTFIDTYILVGLYNYKQRKCLAVLLDSNHAVVDEQPLPSNFEKFYQSCIQKYYAVSTSMIQEIQVRRNILMLKYINNNFFYDKIIYYHGFYEHYFYIMEPHVSKQAHFYYIENTQLKTIKFFVAVGDEHYYNAYQKDMEQMVLSRKSDIATQRRLRGYINGEEREGDEDGYYETETVGEFIRKGNLKSKYKDVHSQLFVVDSSLFIFDFENGNLENYSPRGEKINYIPFTFHQQMGWKPYVQKVVDDYFTSYISENGAVFVSKISRDLSVLSTNQLLYYNYARKWKVHNGFVYYLHSPKGYLNNVFLFREVLQ